MAAESKRMQKYFESMNCEVMKAYKIAEESKKKGFDPDDTVNVPLAKNMAERVEGLISTAAPEILGTGIVERITELEKQYGSQDWRVALKIAEEVAMEKFCKFETKKKAIEIGVRIGFAYVTVGVVSSPLEGLTEIKLKKRKDNGQEYFCLMYSGPIRSAGGTGASVSVLIADYIRKKMGYAQYDATEQEIKRMNTELADYHERVTNLQYFPSNEEVEYMMKNMPVQIDGDPSEKFEVSNYKDLDRIETNRIRNGPCLVIAECLCAKAPKLLKKLLTWGKDFDLEQWDFISGFIELQKKIKASLGGTKKESVSNEKVTPDFTYIKDLVGGRPVISHPLRNGGLRLRYGRCRTSGFSSDAISPATMAVLENYIAIGTQLKMERPGKATTLTVCDSIDGPIVKLNNGSVKKLRNYDEAVRASREVSEILYLGDILINYGDFRNRNHKLIPAGFVEEWWVLYLKNKTCSLGEKRIKEIIHNPNNLSFEEAKILSKELQIPLHPKFIFFWNSLSNGQLSILFSSMKRAAVSEERTLVPNLSKEEKRTFELIGLEHTNVNNEYIIIENEEATALLENLGNLAKPFQEDFSTPLDAINLLSDFQIKDKCGYFIGARMGRPEKAKLRKLKGSPNTLFPIGQQGGKLREFRTALKEGKVTSQFPIFFCEKCSHNTVLKVCENCGNRCVQQYYCRQCAKDFTSQVCQQHGKCLTYKEQMIDIHHYTNKAKEICGITELPESMKGVRGTSNVEHIPEHIAKGFLRAKHHLSVNKDGTIRYDMTEMACTHFKPKEVGASIRKLKEMGYDKDIYGHDLIDEDQILELFCQDVILPACPESPDEGADAALFRVASFIDEMLVKLYGLEPHYNLTIKEELIGHLVVAMSPHTSAGIVSRIVGFSRVQGLMAHPLLHSIMRRDCFSYDTSIPIMKDGIWRNIRIGEIVDNLKPDKKVDFFGTLSKKVNDYYTIGMDKDGKITKVKINDFTKHTPSKILKIKTNDGRTIRVTETHKFLVMVDNKLKKVIASDLLGGARLVIPLKTEISSIDTKFIELNNYFESRKDVMVRNVNVFVKKFVDSFGGVPKLRIVLNLPKNALYNFLSRDSFPLPLFLVLFSLSGYEKLPPNIYLAAKRDNVVIPNKIPLNGTMLNIIGLYVAEGHARKNTSKKGFYQVSFAVTEIELRKKVISTFKNLLDLDPTETKKDGITYSSRLLYELFVDILKCGRNAYEKRIPEMIMNLPLEKLKFFLQGYYDGDGSVSYSDCRVCCDSVSEGLLQDLEFCLRRYGIFTKRYWYKKQPGQQVKEFYIRKNRKIPEFEITKLTIPSTYYHLFYERIGFSLTRKQTILKGLVNSSKPYGMKIEHDNNFVYPIIKEIIEDGFETTYCLNVENHLVLANGFLVGQCDGDEAAVLLLMDHLLNFSSKFLPNSRGSTQDAPLVLTSKLIPTEVDDMVFDMDIVDEYPLEFYEAAEQYKLASDVKIGVLNNVLNTEKQYEGILFTHQTSDFNLGVRCSAYKTIPTMQDKVLGQMSIAKKIRAVDEDDVARLVVEKHFMRDIKGCLRKFSMQSFRCTNCNEIYRRPPMLGKCTKCDGRLAFTIAEGSVKKYLEPAINLAETYHLPSFLQQTLELTKNKIESVFGKESEQQSSLGKWIISEAKQ